MCCELRCRQHSATRFRVSCGGTAVWIGEYANPLVSCWLIANLPEQCRIAPLFARIRLSTHADCANLADLFVGRLFHSLDTY